MYLANIPVVYLKLLTELSAAGRCRSSRSRRTTGRRRPAGHVAVEPEVRRAAPRVGDVRAGAVDELPAVVRRCLRVAERVDLGRVSLIEGQRVAPDGRVELLALTGLATASDDRERVVVVEPGEAGAAGRPGSGRHERLGRPAAVRDRVAREAVRAVRVRDDRPPGFVVRNEHPVCREARARLVVDTVARGQDQGRGRARVRRDGAGADVVGAVHGEEHLPGRRLHLAPARPGGSGHGRAASTTATATAATGRPARLRCRDGLGRDVARNGVRDPLRSPVRDDGAVVRSCARSRRRASRRDEHRGDGQRTERGDEGDGSATPAQHRLSLCSTAGDAIPRLHRSAIGVVVQPCPDDPRPELGLPLEAERAVEPLSSSACRPTCWPGTSSSRSRISVDSLAAVRGHRPDVDQVGVAYAVGGKFGPSRPRGRRRARMRHDATARTSVAAPPRFDRCPSHRR